MGTLFRNFGGGNGGAGPPGPPGPDSVIYVSADPSGSLIPPVIPCFAILQDLPSGSGDSTGPAAWFNMDGTVNGWQRVIAFEADRLSDTNPPMRPIGTFAILGGGADVYVCCGRDGSGNPAWVSIMRLWGLGNYYWDVLQDLILRIQPDTMNAFGDHIADGFTLGLYITNSDIFASLLWYLWVGRARQFFTIISNPLSLANNDQFIVTGAAHQQLIFEFHMTDPYVQTPGTFEVDCRGLTTPAEVAAQLWTVMHANSGGIIDPQFHYDFGDGSFVWTDLLYGSNFNDGTYDPGFSISDPLAASIFTGSPADYPALNNPRTPIGPAGGDLTGTYPNPRVLNMVGRDWTHRTGPSAGSYGKAIAYGNGVYIVLSQSFAWTSPDGKNWTQQAFDTSTLTGIAFGNGYFVAVGQGGKVWKTLDGETWTDITPLPPYFDELTQGEFVYDLTLDDDSHVIHTVDLTKLQAMGHVSIRNDRSLGPPPVPNGSTIVHWKFTLTTPLAGPRLTSASVTGLDQTEMTPLTTPFDLMGAPASTLEDDCNSPGFGMPPAVNIGLTGVVQDFGCVCHAADLEKFCALSTAGSPDVAILYDGITWEVYETHTPGPWCSIARGNGVFVAVSPGGEGAFYVTTSVSGDTWGGQTPSTNSAWNTISFGNGMFVAAGAAGAIMNCIDSGVTWNDASDGLSCNFLGSCFDQYSATFILVGYGDDESVYISQDGNSWTPKKTDTASIPVYWTSVCKGSNQVVAIAYGASGSPLVMSSP